ncbi:MAG TPA: hypothetical protein VGI96_35190, partial [Streptosporangiaceae bacterium]
MKRLAQPGELHRVNPPRPLDPFDHGLLPGLAHIGGLDRALRSPGAGDAERPQPPFVPDKPGRGRGHDRAGRVDPRRQVPQPVPAAPPGHGDLTPQHHVLEQLADVPVVGPPGR